MMVIILAFLSAVQASCGRLGGSRQHRNFALWLFIIIVVLKLILAGYIVPIELLIAPTGMILLARLKALGKSKIGKKVKFFRNTCNEFTRILVDDMEIRKCKSEV